MLINFKILAFFWRQFYLKKGREWAKKRTASKVRLQSESHEEFEDETEFNDDQVEGWSNSSKTTWHLKSSKMKASSMTTKSIQKVKG